jgi:hypothetical protein
LGQNTVVGSMTILLSWLCWGACQEKVCLDPNGIKLRDNSFYYK